MSAAAAQANTTEEVPRMTPQDDAGERRRNAVSIGGTEYRVEPVSGSKASRALAILRAIGKAVPDLMATVSAYRREYAEREAVYLERAEALYRAPERVEHFTEEDWQAIGGRIKLTRDPSLGETIAHVFPEALDVAEEHVYRLLALFTMSNADVKRARRAGTINDELDERANELLDDGLFDELLELAVVAGETIDEQITRKTEELGGRLGNALRLLGLDPAAFRPQTPQEAPQTTQESQEAPSSDTPATSNATPPSSRPTSSTDSPARSNGHPTPPSTNPSPSSTRSSDVSNATTPA